MNNEDVKIAVNGVWKIFGDNPKAFMAEHNGQPQSDIINGSGYIGAVQDVSLSVRTGEILVIMGLSGSGKSTLVRCISQLLEPTAGEIVFDGQDLAQASEAELIQIRRHKMGMVFQNFGLLPHRTVLSNVAFPLEVQGIGRNQREDRAAEILSLVGLEGRENYFPRELSGGQQQRVGIARSLAVEPDVWFLDEPFSALDPLIRREMQDEFLRLQRMLSKTIVFITHDFDEATRLADRIGIMKDGRLIQLSTPAEMVLNPADDYVAEFTKNAPRDRIFDVGSIMQPVLTGAAMSDHRVAQSARISEVAAIVMRSELPVAVVGEGNAVVGTLDRDGLVNALYGDAP